LVGERRHEFDVLGQFSGNLKPESGFKTHALARPDGHAPKDAAALGEPSTLFTFIGRGMETRRNGMPIALGMTESETAQFR